MRIFPILMEICGFQAKSMNFMLKSAEFEDTAASRHQNPSRNLWISTKSMDFQTNCFHDVALLEVEREMRIFSNFDGNLWILSKIHRFHAKICGFPVF